MLKLLQRQVTLPTRKQQTCKNFGAIIGFRYAYGVIYRKIRGIVRLLCKIIKWRIKRYTFEETGITFSIPRALTLSDCAFRVVFMKFDTYSVTSLSAKPREYMPIGTPITLKNNFGISFIINDHCYICGFVDRPHKPLWAAYQRFLG